MPRPNGKATTKIVTFTRDKETTNTVRYQEDGLSETNRGSIPMLYVQKSVFGKSGFPETLKVTLEIPAAA